VFKTPHCGWGLRARECIEAGALVQEYLGEVIDFSEMSHRLEKYCPGQPM
jgi:SET domain-containing protein